MSAFTLRNKIEESKAMYLERRGKLDWQWTDEGLPYRDGYHAAAKLIEKKSEVIESRKSLMLWRDDFTSENKWASLCAALGVPEDTVTLELKCNIVATFPYKK